jgi:hypothetical protein
MDPWRLPIGEHRDPRNRVLEISRLEDTIIAIDSESYGPDGEPKDSVDQDTVPSSYSLKASITRNNRCLSFSGSSE